MLTLLIPGEEYFNEEDQTFETLNDSVLTLEHSLVSLSKWESKFKKPFLGTQDKTSEEIVTYIKYMILGPFDPEVFEHFTEAVLDQINDYINASQTATTFNEAPAKPGRGEIISAELIYYWMVAFNIPFECQHWHLSRLFALIRVCNIKNQAPKKMSKTEIAQRNRDLNAERKAKLGTSG